jgi:hypothetical protein
MPPNYTSTAGNVNSEGSSWATSGQLVVSASVTSPSNNRKPTEPARRPEEANFPFLLSFHLSQPVLPSLSISRLNRRKAKELPISLRRRLYGHSIILKLRPDKGEEKPRPVAPVPSPACRDRRLDYVPCAQACCTRRRPAPTAEHSRHVLRASASRLSSWRS